nr:F-box only protein 5-like [Nerophis lumbriciformis]
MKSPRLDEVKAKRDMERSSPEKKNSPIKDPLPFKPPVEKVRTVLFPCDPALGEARDKENKTVKAREGIFDKALEDSGYLSLQSSQIDEGDHHCHGRFPSTSLLRPPVTPKKSALCQDGAVSGCRASVLVTSTPVDKQKALASFPNLPIIKFQEAVCQELAKSYSENKRYDWSVISRVAKDHPLHQVIGRSMGLEFIDIFSRLLSKNMLCILSNILALLGDTDLISCKKVSRTWRRIIREDSAATRRCRHAEQVLQESLISLRQKNSGLTRDAVASRLVMSRIQRMASPHRPSSTNSQTTPLQKTDKSRFNEFLQAASTLKSHESLKRCTHCGSPAVHSPELRQAACTRSSCQFLFCTKCHEAYHGAKPCRAVPSRSAQGKSVALLPCSAQSKKNIRRL